MARHSSSLHRRDGFTLVELSIVLVIVALVAGGVLAGRDLIRTAQLRGQVSEWEQFAASVHAFKLKYGCLPGDCPSPSRFFSEAAGNTLYAGNGDFWIDRGAANYNNSAGWMTERNALFQHLFLARLGFITGRRNCCADPFTPGKTLPGIKSGGSNETWMVFMAPCNISAFCPAGLPGVVASGHYLVTGTMGSGGEIYQHINVYGSQDLLGGQFTPSDASFIDVKMDDGRPLSGKVVSSRAWTVNPYSSYRLTDFASNRCMISPAANAYDFTVTTKACSLMIGMPF